jgi:uncharacterized membrane protein (UPF0127 family)
MPQPVTAEARAARRPGRRPRQLAAALCLCAGLSPLLTHAAQPASPPKGAPPAADEGFPRSALEIRSASGRQWFNIRIADTEARRELGLMFVTKMPSDEGMLFPEDRPQVMSMWMKNTYIPLDMLFIDTRGYVVCLIANAKPESLDILSCDKPAKAVLEINGGEAQRRGIHNGDQVIHALFHK